MLENVSAGHYDRFDRPPFVQSAYNVSWSRPAFNQRTASKALGGTIPNDNGNEKKLRARITKNMMEGYEDADDSDGAEVEAPKEGRPTRDFKKLEGYHKESVASSFIRELHC